ncbi:uncharacterized protein EDB91DRAFT_1240205 [Suillus paluster]|uniref:uncharacterized protein n=1 Tax=Suillus paluster TaxID=48578 RepID=UPI001B8608CA|nr:uncharacterized protein EDB91DRAFT_1240205 [Suillus paluster]KAG1722536.1 hypothetical protein EDB91DRAFT_1240205 [Suillus paluster]
MGDCLMEGDNCWAEEEMNLGGNCCVGETMLCPNCSGEFPSIEAVVLHLNSQSNTCWSHKECPRPEQFPVPPGLRGPHSSTSSTTWHFHPHSGYVFGLGKNLFDRLEEDQFAYQQKLNTYYPFCDKGEWELAKFLVENLNQTQIDKFLKLKWFNTRPRLSFTSKDELLDWIDGLPSFVQWKVSDIKFKGYKTTYPIQFIWRDALEVVKQLFSDPVFANHMSYQPHIVNIGNQREYGDYMSADMAWKIQDYLPLGATQVPIILGSDKTPVTRTTGGLEMHPLFITIGNIDSDVCCKATLRAWRCIAYMPIAKFHVHPDYQTILQAQLWHKCIDLVCANLKVTAKQEATMIAAVSKKISNKIDPWDLDKFQKAAKAVHLSGVHMPFWRDWLFTCPSVFLAGEVLHTCHKFFADHLLKWIKETLGKPELDARFINQHKRVGTHHFTKGITHVNQMTGCEHRDIQCTIVASIAGAAPPRFIRAIRAFVDFIYLAQNLVHSPESLQLMVKALSDFHEFKGAIIEAEARRGRKGVKEDFFIPELELLQSFSGTVKKLGTLMQFSADMTERMLITHCKDLFVQTSQRASDFTEQCIRILNRQESMELFNLYTLVYSHGVSLVNDICNEDAEVTTINPVLSWVSHVLPDEAHSIHGPWPGILSGDALTAFPLTATPDFKSLSPVNIYTKYSLVDFEHTLSEFIRCSSLSSGEHTHWKHSHGHFCTWNKFQLQLHSAFQARVIMPSRVIQAYPPTKDSTCFDLVLPTYLASPLLYVQYFNFVANPTYVVDQHDRRYRRGGVVSLINVTHAIKLIPEYGNKVDENISLVTCLESYDCFFLNSFADKESYHTFSTEFA